MNFNGLILRDLRESFNLSRKDLGDKLNVSEQSIWQYESNIAVPKFENLNTLKRIFGVDISYFQRERPVSKVVSSQYIAYRSDLKNSVKSTDRETVYVSVVDDFINNLLKKVTLPDPIINDLYLEVNNMRQNDSTINEIAHTIRKRLNIDSQNKMLIAAIEKAGVFVFERSLNKDVDAYSTWTEFDRPYIILGKNKSAVRRMIDIAHELGHILLHRNQSFSEENTPEIRRIEKEAFQFASALLLDQSDFEQKFTKYVKDPTNPKDYLKLKEYYYVSIGALEMRANNLGLITSKQSGYFWGKLTKYGYKKHEPLDDELPLIVPGKIYAIFSMLSRAKIKDLYAETGVNRNFINQLIISKPSERVHSMKKLDDSVDNVLTLFK
ncbi:XRE family transcriptional regulator [Leuconostoc gelidum subsp. gasicomitatum]|uniref:spr1629 family repressor/antitoxin n=1 Tax=Leuconostoc gasicomitatum TaxID=115778 RepID=UPI001CC36E0C|nr:XRE family transcriptional regulator [Leuconostoc gasicomitatum]MBZ5960946.1 XRE family transcriptional regulator [Leuconostoc gasicomitatum]MBZ5993675.1 XRE family transcriptional regulator [Leuconostoc gasicomitatum]